MYPQIETDAEHINGTCDEHGITAAIMEAHRISQARGLNAAQYLALMEKAAEIDPATIRRT
jgi:hypothetical protein